MNLSGRLARFFRDARGAAAVELAVVVPFLALLLVGIADFGRANITSSVVAHAAEAGALYGAQDSASAYNSAGIETAATQDAGDVGSITVASRPYCTCTSSSEVSCSSSCGAYGIPRMYVSVRVSKRLDLTFPYPGVPDSLTNSVRLRVK